MSMVSKLVPALVTAAVFLVAGCGGQSTTLGASGNKRPQKRTPAQAYLTKLAHRPEVDNEGPEKPIPGRAPTWSYRVVLTGHNALPRGTSSGSTAALVRLRGNKVCWRFGALPAIVASTEAFGRVRTAFAPTGATIRLGAKNKAGPVVVVFGARYSRVGCIVVARVIVNSIASAPRFYYLNLTTARYPKGALRAQL